MVSELPRLHAMITDKQGDSATTATTTMAQYYGLVSSLPLVTLPSLLPPPGGDSGNANANVQSWAQQLVEVTVTASVLLINIIY